MGKSGLASVGVELKQLEMEREKLRKEIKAMTEQESPFKRISEAGQAFLENWKGIGDILEGAEPDEQRYILQHFVQSLRLTFTDEEEKRAEYSLTLFPEVGPRNFNPQNEKVIDQKSEQNPEVLIP